MKNFLSCFFSVVYIDSKAVSIPSISVTFTTVIKRCARRSLSSFLHSLNFLIGFFGINKICIGACGLISLIAIHNSSSYINLRVYLYQLFFQRVFSFILIFKKLSILKFITTDYIYIWILVLLHSIKLIYTINGETITMSISYSLTFRAFLFCI